MRHLKSPTVHFDNHLDPVSRVTSKWRISRGYSCFMSILCLSHYLMPLHIYRKYSCWVMKKKSNRKMCHETLAKIIFGHFCRHGIKTWKSWPSFFKFQSMSILAILCNRRQETISIWLKYGFIFNFNMASFLRTPVGWIKCECHYWLICVQTPLPPPPTLPTPCNKKSNRRK